MKYTKENLIGIGIKSSNKEESLIIIEKLKTLGIDGLWSGSNNNANYGLSKKGSAYCSSFMTNFHKIISFEEFMNENKDEVIDNFEIF